MGAVWAMHWVAEVKATEVEGVCQAEEGLELEAGREAGLAVAREKGGV